LTIDLLRARPGYCLTDSAGTQVVPNKREGFIDLLDEAEAKERRARGKDPYAKSQIMCNMIPMVWLRSTVYCPIQSMKPLRLRERGRLGVFVVQYASGFSLYTVLQTRPLEYGMIPLFCTVNGSHSSCATVSADRAIDESPVIAMRRIIVM
jgi:hypothetical protein